MNESSKAAIRVSHILLIDDGLTTGPALNEVAQTLSRTRCKSVTALVIGRVKYASDQIINLPIKSCDLVRSHLNDRE